MQPGLSALGEQVDDGDDGYEDDDDNSASSEGDRNEDDVYLEVKTFSLFGHVQVAREMVTIQNNLHTLGLGVRLATLRIHSCADYRM